MRRKNPHPKRAVNARTVLKVRERRTFGVVFEDSWRRMISRQIIIRYKKKKKKREKTTT